MHAHTHTQTGSYDSMTHPSQRGVSLPFEKTKEQKNKTKTKAHQLFIEETFGPKVEFSVPYQETPITRCRANVTECNNNTCANERNCR